MDGDDCPIHKKPVWLLSTTNEWRWYCRFCDERFNDTWETMSGFVVCPEKRHLKDIGYPCPECVKE